ncbi:FAD/NADP-binding domain-containing protein [Dacryopinax primogenitus]|uniref:FAD/NADP-binding domain-containing protein n=1 Tax=Dacryopinax primogenitus (strain DJM 731) TaxID=1858805 RepID=M5FUV4_DACPD|nr:FAD/NADP-binding domain-containing protein [Dacryopinax primogenitus]EJT99304.1 FAD/NADP-binding domain-containing protein [Dacryopinax primogenitus]
MSVTLDSLPKKAQILVIGGGPGGAFTAAALSREGFEVVVLEKAKFPRYHIGESMLPSVRPFMKFIDLEETIMNHGFTPKPGAAVKFVQWKREAYTDFISLDPNNGAWNVVRSEFDELILRHAAKCGAKVFEEVTVTEIEFTDNDPTKRPIAVTYRTRSKEFGRMEYDYLVDASGRAGLISTRYLKNRDKNLTLDNVACWGYWKGTKQYRPGTTRHNAPWFEALTDETGWNWFIPLHNGTTSVGVVMNQAKSNERKKRATEANGGNPRSLKDHYLDCLKLTPGLCELLGEAELVDDGVHPIVQAAADFSYAAKCYSGDHWRLVGDAAAFIDPFFSSGVHLAFTDGLSAAASIASSIRGDFPEEQCWHYHDKKVGTAYTRFSLVVMSAYKQMLAQSEAVLADINSDNFDRAFDLIRPVIQGAAETGKTLSADEVNKTMDFVQHVFAATDPEMHEAVGARIDPTLFSPTGKMLTPNQVDEIFGEDDEEARAVVKEINARKAVHIMYDTEANFSNEDMDGLAVRVKHSSLGLIRVEDKDEKERKKELIIIDRLIESGAQSTEVAPTLYGPKPLTGIERDEFAPMVNGSSTIIV